MPKESRKYFKRTVWVELEKNGRVLRFEKGGTLKRITQEAGFYLAKGRVAITKKTCIKDLDGIARLTGQDHVTFPQLISFLKSRNIHTLVPPDIIQLLEEGTIPDQRDRCPTARTTIKWFPIPRTKSP